MDKKETPKKSFERNLGHVCRLCCNETDRCTNMFSKAGQEKQLKEKVLKTTGLRVENNDDASLLVCRKCERSVNNITVFQEKVTQSQRVFAQTFFFKRVIEMSPSQETLSVRKKHMADTEAQLTSRKKITFLDVCPTPVVESSNATTPQVIPCSNQASRFQRFVTVHHQFIGPSVPSTQRLVHAHKNIVEQPVSVNSTLGDIFLAKPLTPSETAAVDRSTSTKEPTAVAHIIKTKTPTVFYAIKRDIVNSLSESCSQLCRRKNGSILLEKSYEDMSDFDFDKVWKELVECHPFFLDVLNAIVGETCDLADTPPSLRVKHCFIYSILMIQRWHELSPLQRINTVLMISGGGSKQVYI